jgi:transposase
VLAHLGRVDDILKLHQQQKEVPVKISSVSAGAVTALHRLAQEFDLAGRINRAMVPKGEVQVRDELTVGESLVAAMIARACAPRSKRAFADWAKTTYLPELMKFAAADLTSQHFWDQMNAVPVDKLAVIEQELVREVVRIEQLQLKALAYDTTNFYTHIASTNLRPKLPQRGHNKQGRHDLRQMGLALVVDQDTQLPLTHALYEGARSDMKTFAEFLKPVRKRLRELTGQPEQLTIVFDAGASSRQNLESMVHYVTAVRPSNHRALLAEAAAELTCPGGAL